MVNQAIKLQWSPSEKPPLYKDCVFSAAGVVSNEGDHCTEIHTFGTVVVGWTVLWERNGRADAVVARWTRHTVVLLFVRLTLSRGTPDHLGRTSRTVVTHSTFP
jgi:hypothetical protein